MGPDAPGFARIGIGIQVGEGASRAKSPSTSKESEKQESVRSGSAKFFEADCQGPAPEKSKLLQMW